MAPRISTVYCFCKKTSKDFYSPCTCPSCRQYSNSASFEMQPLWLEPCSEECAALQKDWWAQTAKELKPYIDKFKEGLNNEGNK